MLNAPPPATFFAKNAVVHSALGSVFVGYASSDDLNKRANRASPTVGLVKGGSIALSLIAYNHSIVNINGGSTGTGGVTAFDNSTINIRGGALGGRNIGDIRSSQISVTAAGSSKVNLFGTDLHTTLTSKGAGAKFHLYTLSGRLSDGSRVDGVQLLIYEGMGARLTLTNPPTSPTKQVPKHIKKRT